MAASIFGWHFPLPDLNHPIVPHVPSLGDAEHNLKKIPLYKNPPGINTPSQDIGGPSPDDITKGIGKAVNSVPDFLSLLTSTALWIRVGEFVVGIILIGIGLSEIFPKVSSTIKKGAMFV